MDQQVQGDLINGFHSVDFDWTNPASQSLLVNAILKKDISEVKRLLNSGKNPNLPDNTGTTPMHVASLSNDTVEILSILINNNGYVHHQTHTGLTPLDFAAKSGANCAATLLIRNGADVNSRNQVGLTPLHLACGSGSLEMVRLLKKGGAELDAVDLYLRSPLMMAAKKNHIDICRYLLKHHCNPLKADHQGRTSFHYVCRLDNLEIFNLLLQHCSPCDKIFQLKETISWPLTLEAAQNSAIKILTRLFDLGADPNKVYSNGMLVIHLAAHTSPTCFHLCLEKTSVNVMNEYCSFKWNRDFVSLPCLLIDEKNAAGLEELLSVEGLNRDVITCPIELPHQGVRSPAAMILFPSNRPDQLFPLFQPYIKRKIPLDIPYPEIPLDQHKYCLQLILEYHLSRERETNCKCNSLAKMLLENRVALTDNRDSPFIHVVLKICDFGCIELLALIIAYAKNLTASDILMAYTEHILNKLTISSGGERSLKYLRPYSHPRTICTLINLVEFSLIPQDVLGIVNLALSSRVIPSLKEMSRIKIRVDIAPKREEAYEVATAFKLPCSLIDFIMYNDLPLNHDHITTVID